MSDEQFGRAWAKQQGKTLRRRVDLDHTGKLFRWVASDFPPWFNWTGLMRFCGCCRPAIADFDTEGEAYAALWRAVRGVHEQLPPLAGVNDR